MALLFFKLITAAAVIFRVVWASRDQDTDTDSCRVAVCFSGHIRSFVYPVVHLSTRRNLVEAIAAEGCRVDVFAYATLPDVVPSFKMVR